MDTTERIASLSLADQIALVTLYYLDNLNSVRRGPRTRTPTFPECAIIAAIRATGQMRGLPDLTEAEIAIGEELFKLAVERAASRVGEKDCGMFAGYKESPCDIALWAMNHLVEIELVRRGSRSYPTRNCEFQWILPAGKCLTAQYSTGIHTSSGVRAGFIVEAHIDKLARRVGPCHQVETVRVQTDCTTEKADFTNTTVAKHRYVHRHDQVIPTRQSAVDVGFSAGHTDCAVITNTPNVAHHGNQVKPLKRCPSA